MHNIKSIRTLLIVAFILSLLPASIAHALSTNNPQWLTKTGTLGESESLSTSAKGSSTTLKLEVGENHVVCKSLDFQLEKSGKPLEHDIKGSSTPNPGTGGESIAFENCEVEGATGCFINGESAGHAKIETELLKDTLVYKSKEAAEHEESKTLTLFEPKGKLFAVVKFSGICPETGEIKTGEEKILAENEQGAAGELIKESHDFTFPATPIKTYFKNVNGKTEEVKLPETEHPIIFLILLVVIIVFVITFFGLR